MYLIIDDSKSSFEEYVKMAKKKTKLPKNYSYRNYIQTFYDVYYDYKYSKLLLYFDSNLTDNNDKIIGYFSDKWYMFEGINEEEIFNNFIVEQRKQKLKRL